MNRRSLLMGASGLAVLAVAACAGQTPEQIGQTVVADATSVTAGLQSALQGLVANSTISAAMAATLSALVNDAVMEAGNIVATMTANEALPPVQQVENDLASFINDLKSYNLPGSVQQILSDIQIVWPLVTAAVGLLSSKAKAGSPAAINAARARLRAL